MVSVKIQNSIIDAFMALVGETSLEAATLPLVAERAGISLGQLRAAYGGRMDILAAFSARTDKAVLDNIDDSLADDEARERLFDVFFSRLEQLGPYRPGIAALGRAARRDPLVGLHLNTITFQSMAWMMAGAGVSHTGKRGALRAQGLVLVWRRVLGVWQDDDDPGLARTMAALDQNLRRGERALSRIGKLECLAARICGSGRRVATGSGGGNTEGVAADGA